MPKHIFDIVEEILNEACPERNEVPNWVLLRGAIARAIAIERIPHAPEGGICEHLVDGSYCKMVGDVVQDAPDKECDHPNRLFQGYFCKTCGPLTWKSVTYWEKCDFCGADVT